MGDLFNLEKKYADEMVAHARAESPDECCGILAGNNGKVIKLYRTTNTEQSPYRYKIDSLEMFAIYNEIQNNKWQLLGVCHSHTYTEAYPSVTDIKSTTLPGSIYLIISQVKSGQAIVRGFYIIDGKITEAELRITES